MGRFIFSYDLQSDHPDPHRAFLQAAEGEGFLYVFPDKEWVLHRLPSGTLWGVFNTKKDATLAFRRALKKTREVLGQPVAVPRLMHSRFNDSTLVSDRKKEPARKWLGKSPSETARLHQQHDPYFRLLTNERRQAA